MISLPTVRKHYCSYYDQAAEQAVLVLEYVAGITLDKVFPSLVGLSKMKEIAAKLAITLQAFHLHGHVYSDLKEENVLVTADGQVKLIDTGLTRPISNVVHAGNCGPHGMALAWPPEFFPLSTSRCYTLPTADWWAFAIVLYTIRQKAYPYNTKSVEKLPVKKQTAALGRLVRRGPTVHLSLCQKDPNFIQLFCRLTDLDLEKRIGYDMELVMQQLFACPWFASVPVLEPGFLEN